jgi:hypothetical protein
MFHLVSAVFSLLNLWICEDYRVQHCFDSERFVFLGMAGDISPGLGIIRSTPPVQQPKARSRKRKQFDKATVLTNKYGWSCNP